MCSVNSEHFCSQQLLINVSIFDSHAANSFSLSGQFILKYHLGVKQTLKLLSGYPDLNLIVQGYPTDSDIISLML